MLNTALVGLTIPSFMKLSSTLANIKKQVFSSEPNTWYGVPVRQNGDGPLRRVLLVPHWVHLRPPRVAAYPQEVAGPVRPHRRLQQLPRVVLVDEQDDGPRLRLLQEFLYDAVEVLGPRIPEDLLRDRDADTTLARVRYERGDALRKEKLRMSASKKPR